MGSLWVLGDSWTDPGWAGWAVYWPGLVSERLGLRLVNSREAGAGYVAPGNLLGSSFGSQAARGAGAGAAAVVVFGSLNDRDADPARVGEAAAGTYRVIRRACPDAPLLVTGPQWGNLPITPGLLAVQAAVRRAAADAGALFLDTLSWFLDRPELMAPDRIHLTEAGHQVLADRLTPELLFLLAGRTPPRLLREEGGGWPAPYAPDEPFAPAS